MMKIRKSNKTSTKRNNRELKSITSYSHTKTYKMKKANNSSCSSLWRRVLSIGLLLQILLNCGLSTATIRNVSLLVDPPSVRRGQHATFICSYDLSGAPLYSVKFYRGNHEFYRYSPSELPTSKVFQFVGFNVDLSMSNASQVVIRNVGFGLSGNFSCEVTADAPSFSTRTAHTLLQVVDLPERKPMLWTEHERYEPGEILVANCSSPPSRPRVELKLSINNLVQYAAEPQYITTTDNLVATHINLRLQLQSSHFHGSPPLTTGGLTLRCMAEIPNLYLESTELELGAKPSDPVPARVTSSSASLPNRTIAAMATASNVIISLGLMLFQRLLLKH
ncbi:uncharacterized protein LOC116338489 [Contarinia nasturtii]|uniref:uncharacterized protein LOC116338489 n=1 Tax=Contarinia nasturtii TaxID=265458 RepID=UPI0012D39624|nr:uncharacterized protein LOC116338489 [Contarinia nasturtii]XP_031619650.1 uncharacterized protein LOC116338489 [Contarinia nasturtii]XP_031619651.1 uncharacterized protein LOC116338489 [Contarinia nasturtii]